ncbi:hypothetical protein [Nocardioides sp.]|uniref:hypothetical protein n=1 Tax=Nocardioides sp. TaxID=35761 RepID=UPI0037833928
MDGLSIEVDNLADVTRALREVGVYVDEPKDALEEIAERGARAVERHTPRRSGRLAGRVSGRQSRKAAVVTASTDYAGVINYGWPARNIAPAQYMQEGEADVLPDAVSIFEDAINDQIKEHHFR